MGKFMRLNPSCSKTARLENSGHYAPLNENNETLVYVVNTVRRTD
jgi:hypothetical protein